MYNEGTIIALSSPPGSGAISIIRLSGKDSISNRLDWYVPYQPSDERRYTKPTGR